MHLRKHTFVVLMASLLLMPVVAQAQVQTETEVNNEYHDIILEQLRKDAQQRQAAMRSHAKQMLLQLPNDQKLYDESSVKITASIQEGSRADGSTEYNFAYNISYNSNHIDAITDDYPSGIYHWDSSNSCRAVCLITKAIIESECADLFAAGKDVTIGIHSTTDGVDIAHINYHGEFGEFRYEPAVYNDEHVRISVSTAEGINTNAQLAYIRARSVRDFFDKQVDKLKGTNNKYEYITKSYAEMGSHYRRSSIEIIVHGAYDDAVEEMISRLTQDNYVDINIPVVEPNSNINSFALVIANEDYMAPLPSVPYAGNDGEIFQQYCVKTLGLPERHVKLIRNASYAEIVEGIAWLKDISVANKGEANLIIYYAGHGINDPYYKPYIIPNGVELSKKNIKMRTGMADFGDDDVEFLYELSGKETRSLLEQSLAIDTLVYFFNKMNVKSITYIFDANFNGRQRSGRPMAMIVPDEEKPKRYRVRDASVILSSSEFNKTSYAFDDQHHGFFTYFLLKELKRTKGQITYEELMNNISRAMTYESSLQGKLQDCMVYPGNKAKETWSSRSFR